MAKTPEEVPDITSAPSIAPASGGEGWHSDLPRVKFEAFLGKVITILEADWRESTFKVQGDESAKKPQYALLRVQCPDKLPGVLVDDEGGEEAVIVDAGVEVTTSTGRIRICEQIRKAQNSESGLPVKGEVAEAGKTSGGFEIWELRAV